VHKGASLVVVSAAPIELPAALADMDAALVVAPDAVGEAHAIVVRPDRYVATVARDAAALEEFATTVMAHVR